MLYTGDGQYVLAAVLERESGMDQIVRRRVLGFEWPVRAPPHRLTPSMGTKATF